MTYITNIHRICLDGIGSTTKTCDWKQIQSDCMISSLQDGVKCQRRKLTNIIIAIGLMTIIGDIIMKIRTVTFLVAAALAGTLALSSSGFAAKGGIHGNPTGGSSGGSPDFGDLIVLYRDARGVPILTDDLCQQPLAAPGSTWPASTSVLACSVTDSCVIPVDSETCAIVVGYEAYAQEVDFGRTSVIRSPESVIEHSLGEVVTKLATAQCTTLDPAGRLVNTSLIDGEVLSATIDSPLESLAIYRQLMLTGDLGVNPQPYNMSNVADVLNMAARALGAATDKTGKVTVDQVVYSNEIMGLTDKSNAYLPKICITVKEEVNGVVDDAVEKCFLDYSAYDYTRSTNFGSLPAPAYIPADALIDGWFEYLAVLDPSVPSFEILQGPIMDNVFATDPGVTEVNIGGFTQAADDAREVIEFTHDRPLPLGYETPVPLCDVPNNDVIYDLSISEESGLQVPTRMVAGAEEGREIIVTVANAGPDTATVGVTVVGEVGVDPNKETVFEGVVDNVEIDADGTYSHTWYFSFDSAATITWTATASAPYDLNMSNNSVTATTKVMITGGGGGKGR